MDTIDAWPAAAQAGWNAIISGRARGVGRRSTRPIVNRYVGRLKTAATATQNRVLLTLASGFVRKIWLLVNSGATGQGGEQNAGRFRRVLLRRWHVRRSGLKRSIRLDTWTRTRP